MSALSPLLVAGFARQAGFTGTALITAVAIAQAESGFRPDAVGDKNLTEQGEVSVGLWQINYRPSRDKRGGLRDPDLNLEPAHNAVAAFAISGQGTKFTPWSTYTSGAYRPFLDNAAEAVAQLTKGKDNMAAVTIVGLVSTPTGKGYWLISSTGSVYAFGDAPYLGGLQLQPDGSYKPVERT